MRTFLPRLAALSVLLASSAHAEGMTNTVIDTENEIIGGFLTKDTTFQQVLDAKIPVKASVENGFMSEGTEYNLVTHLFPGTDKEILVVWDKYDPKALAEAGFYYNDDDPYNKGVPQEKLCMSGENCAEGPPPLPLPDSRPLAVNASRWDEWGEKPTVWQTETGIRSGDSLETIVQKYGKISFLDLAQYRGEGYGGSGDIWCCYNSRFPRNLLFWLTESTRSMGQDAANNLVLMHSNVTPSEKLKLPHIYTIFFKFRDDGEFFETGVDTYMHLK